MIHSTTLVGNDEHTCLKRFSEVSEQSFASQQASAVDFS